MQFQKISAPSLKELFINDLEQKILSGELKIGEKLPSERELAASMQVSRAVVNAGISEMEQKGFLVVKPRVGTFVQDFRKNGTIDTFVYIMKYNGGPLPREDIKSVLEIRICLVDFAVSQAIEFATDAKLQGLVPILHNAKRSETNEELVEYIFEIYHEIAFISGNSLLPLLFMSLKDLVCILWLRYATNYGGDLLYNNTEKLVHYILTRDIDKAIRHVEEYTNEAISGSKEIYM